MTSKLEGCTLQYLTAAPLYQFPSIWLLATWSDLISHQQLLLTISKSDNSKPPRSVVKQTIFKGNLGTIGVTRVNGIFTRITTEIASSLKYRVGQTLMFCRSTSPWFLGTIDALHQVFSTFRQYHPRGILIQWLFRLSVIDIPVSCFHYPSACLKMIDFRHFPWLIHDGMNNSIHMYSPI